MFHHLYSPLPTPRLVWNITRFSAPSRNCTKVKGFCLLCSLCQLLSPWPALPTLSPPPPLPSSASCHAVHSSMSPCRFKLVFLLLNYIMLAFCVPGVCVLAPRYMCGSQRITRRSQFSLYHVGSGIQTQSLDLAARTLTHCHLPP